MPEQELRWNIRSGRNIPREEICIRGRFHIVCVGGEYDLPYQFTFSQASASGQSFDTLEQFASFAAGSRDEALRIFDAERFAALPFMQDLRLVSLYEGLRSQNDRQLGMEEFLVAAGGKKRVTLELLTENETTGFRIRRRQKMAFRFAGRLGISETVSKGGRKFYPSG